MRERNVFHVMSWVRKKPGKLVGTGWILSGKDLAGTVAGEAHEEVALEVPSVVHIRTCFFHRLFAPDIGWVRLLAGTFRSPSACLMLVLQLPDRRRRTRRRPLFITLSLALFSFFSRHSFEATRALVGKHVENVATPAPSSRVGIGVREKEMDSGWVTISEILRQLTPAKKVGDFFKNIFFSGNSRFGENSLDFPPLFSMASLVWLAGGGKRCFTGFTCSKSLVEVTRNLFLCLHHPKLVFASSRQSQTPITKMADNKETTT